MLGHKTSLKTFLKIEILQRICSDGKPLRKVPGKCLKRAEVEQTNTKSHKTRKEITKKIRIYSKLSENANVTSQTCETHLRMGQGGLQH